MRHQQPNLEQSNQNPSSNDTGTNSDRPTGIVQTLEYRRFSEFCDACRRYGYIGLCYGAPGVGKTLSAMSYSRCEKVKQSDRWSSGPTEDPLLDTVFYTPSVVNAPNTIQADIRHCRNMLRDLAKRPLRQEMEGELDAIRRRDDEHQKKIFLEYDWFSGPIPEPQPTYGQVAIGVLKKGIANHRPDHAHPDRRGGPSSNGESRTGARHLRCRSDWDHPDWNARA
jgi:hypothetical protein